ncbi:hypothetical protein Mame_01525 [Martelella mediterranea DSM 17316]|uniref:Uncharacterized protein n=1 Tax=Martelella mediterranea DSM 17316 TaxID=1122214 RepID=A0A1U9YZN6_9HYPH|nr:hypothetical protein Mame_01525 [Martelella mediterranea DSM 17316]
MNGAWCVCSTFPGTRAFELRPPLEAYVSLMATQFRAAFN